MRRPLSIKVLLQLGGYKLGGQNREALARFLDDALFSLWQAALAERGGEHAAKVMFFLLKQDPTYKPEPWLMYAMRRHKAALREEFAEAPSESVPLPASGSDMTGRRRRPSPLREW